MIRTRHLLFPLAALALLSGASAQAQGRGFAKTDTNGDGELSTSEISARKAEIFARLDRNGDGFIDRSELEALNRRAAKIMSNAGPMGALMAEAVDTNQDGRISQAEFTAPGAWFAEADTDNSGGLSPAEAEAFRAAHNK
ncbi:EF-hand domain-containing protein [Pseudooceanicola sp. CBS1P-1]|uniref:EF-hand domain-containing protein n=1 Tax=Pseudooceanicola albus TaxID=2692189 RepID=A0A6L7G0P7_9RHOB|nr:MULTISPECIES: EF-hand domain-containing protein [Pseudooceanicola]MBT9382549.1 EF-hand domain-containing protein [Pseudooceanicola endophyticus]MXN17090.1 hypothetical protein [Pseudooceanicola albus]